MALVSRKKATPRCVKNPSCCSVDAEQRERERQETNTSENTRASQQTGEYTARNQTNDFIGADNLVGIS